MSHSRKPVLTSELLASRQPFREGVYVVGPFASRVSFSSQQRRAISLVCDIDSDLRSAGDVHGIGDKDVCIVGAGIAGLTCAVAVAALGGNADVHEKILYQDRPGVGRKVGIGEVLATIRGAEHRDAHPTLNFWPHENIEPFTRLPFLNWHEGDCTSVAQQFVAQLDKLMSRPATANLISIRTGFDVNDIVAGLTPGKLRPVYEVQTGAPTAWTKEYDLVILALGFGQEKTAPGSETPSYWDPEKDCIPTLRDAPPGMIKHYIVSGTGDGGLIEALRLRFRDLRAGNIDATMEGALGGTRLRSAIAKIENQAHKKYADNVLHGRGSQPSKRTREVVARFLWEQYNGLLGLFGDGVIKSLEEACSLLPPITLLGEWSFPMELSASPYHRLLLTIACRHGWIVYRKAADIRASGTTQFAEINVQRGTKIDKINVPMTTVTANIYDPVAKRWLGDQDHHDSFFIARYGYISPLEALYDDLTLIGRIRRQQSLYADQDALIVERAREMASRLGLPDPSDAKEFYDEHKDNVKIYFEKKFEALIKLADSPLRFEIRSIDGGPVHNAAPTKLFDIDIVKINRSPPDTFGRTGS
jgi:hypothetical protein